MKRILCVLAVLTIAAMMVPACGGGGGGGGGGIGSNDVLKAIAIFTNDTYVDYITGDSVAEASNMEVALRDMGHTVTPFTDITSSAFSDALSGKEVLVIPELEKDDLNSALDAQARKKISSFVNRGGILVVCADSHGADSYYVDLINATFGFSIAPSTVASYSTLTYDPVEADGTPFEGAVPESLYAPSATRTLDTTSLPSNARIIFKSSSGNSALTYIPKGDGHIVISGWDWYESKPVGITDYGWWGVLYRAVSLNANHPDVFFLSGKDTVSWREDVVDKLMQTGQFGSVAQTYIDLNIPTLPEVSPYDVLLVSSDGDVADTQALGNVLADYVDSGGGLVLSVFTHFGSNNSPSARFLDDNYYVIPYGTSNVFSTASLGTVHYDSHPIMAGVREVDQGLHIAESTLVAGAAMIARWDDNNTAVATRTVNGFRRADLGYYPVSSDQYSGGWDTTTDGALLIANALTWTTNLPEPDYLTVISADSFPMPIGSPIGNNCSIASTLPVSSGPESISKVTITMDIEHRWLSDLDITLESAEGTILDLSSDNGSSGDDYSDVTFDDAAGNAIAGLGSTFTPFTGFYIPEEALATLRGEDSNGTWTLSITDDVCGDTGGVGLTGWSISVR